MALNLFTIPPEAPFLDRLAEGWLHRVRASGASGPLAVAHGLILLPTRRSARGLAEAFLRASDGAPLLLPRITALGAPDEAALTLESALDLPPAVEPTQRLAALTTLILALRGRDGIPDTADRAWVLAEELAALMDEAERAEVDLARALPDAADPAYATHWARTLAFLHIVTGHWPVWLADNGLMNPAARMVQLLNAQAAAWERAPPPYPVVIAGTTAGIPAVARLLRVVARLPQGMVVLPALDRTMQEDAWQAIEASHPQAGLAGLLRALDATRDDVGDWPAATDETLSRSAVPGQRAGRVSLGLPGIGPVPYPAPAVAASAERAARFAMLSRTLLPAAALADWHRPGDVALNGLFRLASVDQQHEAEAIALVLRETLETPGHRAALITPDRDLAGRVAAALLRHGVIADDSAGEKLSDTPPAVFLRLLAHAVAEELAPVPLLALLKHPLTSAGLSPSVCRAHARMLEVACLRGPRLRHGIAGLRRALAEAKNDLREFLGRVETCLEPALRLQSAPIASPSAQIDAVIEAAERLAATDLVSGATRLWSGEEGDALATTLAAARDALPMLPDQKRSVTAGLLDALLSGGTVRSRRALRGREGAEHPRVFIWGLLEARLQSVDVAVLGGLVEGVWPPAADPGPWLSRPMRSAMGLPSPEEAVGQTAHDFCSTACAAPTIVLSCPARRDGAPAVPARWLTRLEMFLAGQQAVLPEHPAASWAMALDMPAGGPSPVSPPRPCPPLDVRPNRLSVTEIETLLRDPYAIYARHILRIQALKPLDEETDASDYGSVVHEGLHQFLTEVGTAWPRDASERLRGAMRRSLSEADLREALAAWWEPRLLRIADWVADHDEQRRSNSAPVAIETEKSGTWTLEREGREPFRLVGRADRIERRADGTLAILDYKTGQVPSEKDVEAGLAPQLLLEAMMAAEGGFGDTVIGRTAELIYWKLGGGYEPGEATSLFKGDPQKVAAAIAHAGDSLRRLLAAFDEADRPYLAQPHPGREPRFPQYRQLSRVAEWSAAGDDA